MLKNNSNDLEMAHASADKGLLAESIQTKEGAPNVFVIPSDSS
jgi:hypothetical protein